MPRTETVAAPERPGPGAIELIPDITGMYRLYRQGEVEKLVIPGVSPHGELLDAYVGHHGTKRRVIGSYDPATNMVTFNDASKPGEVLLTHFYTGYMIWLTAHAPQAMAGTYHELEIEVTKLASLTPLPKHQIEFKTETSGWYAEFTDRTAPL